MGHLTGIHSKKCVVKNFSHIATIRECIYVDLDGIAYYCNCYVILLYDWQHGRCVYTSITTNT